MCITGLRSSIVLFVYFVKIVAQTLNPVFKDEMIAFNIILSIFVRMFIIILYLDVHIELT